jgi:hypothetical protein
LVACWIWSVVAIIQIVDRYDDSLGEFVAFVFIKIRSGVALCHPAFRIHFQMSEDNWMSVGIFLYPAYYRIAIGGGYSEYIDSFSHGGYINRGNATINRNSF